MNTLILLAALSSQITFKTSQQGNMTTIIPQVILTESCECRVQVLSVRQGLGDKGHCCKVSDEAAFCLIQRPYISKTLLTRRISPRGSP
jgi:hypothetical protein